MDLAVLDEILQSCSQEARKRLMDFMEALITANENKDEIIKQMEVERNEQEQQIQTISSDNQKLSVTVQEQNFLIQDLTSNNQNMKIQVSQKDKQIEQMKQQNNQMQKDAEEVVAKYKKMVAETEQIIDERVQAERNSIKKTNIAWHKHLDEREKRRQKFTGSFMAIFLINFMCIVSLWITDHTEVFVGKAGVANFFISLENGFISTSRGIIYFLNCAVSVLQRCMSIDVAQAIVYGLSLIWVFIWVVLGILKAIPDVRKKFEDIISIYKNNGEFGYKKAVTISLCTIALCCAIFVAEYAMFNVITIWLILSVSFNILYHLIAYEIS